MNQKELDDAGIALTPHQYDQAANSGICFLLVIVFGIGAAIVHVATPAEKSKPATVVAAR